jgi:hypothetical protein
VVRNDDNRESANVLSLSPFCLRHILLEGTGAAGVWVNDTSYYQGSPTIHCLHRDCIDVDDCGPGDNHVVAFSNDQGWLSSSAFF